MASVSVPLDTLRNAPWRDLYLQALFETDESKVVKRIASAEQALISREHELFSASATAAEREAVNIALHALSALKLCLLSREHRLAA